MSADLVKDCLACLNEAHQNDMITDHSLATMQTWLKEPRYTEFAQQLADLIVCAKAEAEIWKALDDAYWTVIPFGTGGRRGKMFPVGSNAINDRNDRTIWPVMRVVQLPMTRDIVQNILAE